MQAIEKINYVHTCSFFKLCLFFLFFSQNQYQWNWVSFYFVNQPNVKTFYYFLIIVPLIFEGQLAATKKGLVCSPCQFQNQLEFVVHLRTQLWIWDSLKGLSMCFPFFQKALPSKGCLQMWWGVVNSWR